MLVDSIDHPKPSGGKTSARSNVHCQPNTAAATEGTVLGPFHTHDAHTKSNGQDIDSDNDGTPLLVYCSLKDTKGKPIPGASVDVWETDSKGFYDVQYATRDGPHGRATVRIQMGKASQNFETVV